MAYTIIMKNNNTPKNENRKMYVTVAEAKALGLPTVEEQINQWNELQKQIRAGR